MVNKLREFRHWFVTRVLRYSAPYQHDEVRILDPKDWHDEAAALFICRQILKVKDFSQVKRQLSPDDRKPYAAAASLVYNSQPFLDIITEIQYDQLVFMGLQSENDRQLMIGRGTINGADLIETRMRELDAEHQQNVKDNQPIDIEDRYTPVTPLN